MDKPYIQLTDTERAILESYKTTITGLAEYLGEGYELVLHSLECLEQSVIHIVNGHYSGRAMGAPITDLALQMLEQINSGSERKAISYLSRDKKGELLKSTTIPIFGQRENVIGLICVNFYTSTPLSKLLEGFAVTPERERPALTETFYGNTDEMILSNLEEVCELVLNDRKISLVNKNKEIISLLYERGLFQLKNAVLIVAERLGISKNTVYMHIRKVDHTE